MEKKLENLTQKKLAEKQKKTRKTQRGGKKKLNEFFKTMLKAKEDGAKSFNYKGKTYRGREHPRLGMVYSKV